MNAGFEHTFREALTEYQAIRALNDIELAQCIRKADDLLRYRENMSGRLALLLSDWRSSLVTVLEDRHDTEW